MRLPVQPSSAHATYRHLLLLLLLAGSLAASVASPPPPPSSRVVRTKYGDLSGVAVTLDARHLEPVEVYRGIPYASPPTGRLRFMPPVTGAMWGGIRAAEHFGPVCPQRLPDISNETASLLKMSRGRYDYLKRLLPYLSNQSEDCLYLNIYAPSQGTRDGSNGGGLSRYPVMVFIHGESYEWNSGNPYDGSVLASYGGVVVVTVNYRLGILGFLNVNSASEEHLRAPSNYGLMDQIAALHWIQENIAEFGGDPGNVTLMGHGTGAACVHFLMTSSAVPDGTLFHRAVLMSGSALSPWALVRSPARYSQQVARHANCSPDQLSLSQLLKCLREKPLRVLLDAPVEPPQFSPAFGPSLDGVVIDGGENPRGAISSGSDPTFRYDSFDATSPDATNDATSGGVDNDVVGTNAVNSVMLRKSVVSRLSRYDVLTGVVRAEAYFAFTGEDVQYGIEADRRSAILRTFVKTTYRYHLSEILATIVNEYTDWERPVQHPINIRDETLEALSDAQVVAPVVHTADLHSAARKNCYLYVFDYQTKFGDYPQRQGCVHGEELSYVFGAPLVGGLSHFTRNYTKSEILLSEATIIYWSNFARTGNPNEPAEPDPVHGIRLERNRFKNIEWTAYESVHKKYLYLDTKPRVKSHYRAHRLSFWLKLVPDLHRAGGDDVPPSHHQLDDNEDGYDDFHPPPQVGAITVRPPHDTMTPTTTSPTTWSITLIASSSDIVVNASSSVVPVFASELSPGTDLSTPAPQHQGEDGFAAYSTALSVTIAIGCSLLVLNVLIFAGVYYQRDKTRLMHHQEGKKRAQNGQMPNNICGDILVDGGGGAVIKSTDSMNRHHHHHHHHHQQQQMPPPEFADLPPPSGDASTLPRPPPPPKTSKPQVPALSSSHNQQGCEAQPLLPSHNLQMLNVVPGAGSLTRKGCGKMEELRV